MKANPDATAEQVWNSLGIKDEGVVVKYHDPATGEYTYMSKVTNDDGDTEIVSAKSGELKDKFGQGKKADGALADAEEIYLSVSRQASQTTDSWDKFSNSARNRLETSIDRSMEDNPNTLRYLMHKKVGGQSQTFADALRSGKDGIGLSESIIAGLEGVNSDGDGELSRGDFASGEEGTKNYNKVVNSILNGELDKTNPGATKSMYLDFMDKEFENEHNLRKKVKTPTGDPTDTDTDTDLGIKNSDYIGFVDPKRKKMSGGVARTIKKNIIDGNGFNFSKDGTTEGIASYDFIDGQWYENYVDEENKGTLIGSADDMVQNVIRTNHQAFQGLETTGQGGDTYTDAEGVEQERKKPVKQAEGTYVVSAPTINISKLAEGDNEVAKALNELMPVRYGEDNPEGYYWDVYEAFGMFDDPFYQTIVLRDKQDNIV